MGLRIREWTLCGAEGLCELEQLENEIVRQVTEANAEEERKKAAGEEQKS